MSLIDLKGIVTHRQSPTYTLYNRLHLRVIVYSLLLASFVIIKLLYNSVVDIVISGKELRVRIRGW